ncbi:hypothetical protein CTEN210_01075 [Chaetoceros tenuissimus]|uniref:Uncharacterized protein n=1 Tax=Chaetoceros tenuissimus TaxID=426638 RepID=A0AAD3CGW7_9STRA|nr:hypothetical protein CTEN210_01075 [Chaetoceros tenuissimus]
MSQQLSTSKRSKKRKSSSSSSIHRSVEQTVRQKTTQSLLFSPSIRPHVGSESLSVQEKWNLLGFKNYQKDVVNQIMQVNSEKVTEEGKLKPTWKHTCVCPNEFCSLKQKEKVYPNWSNPYSHLTTCYGGENALYDIVSNLQNNTGNRSDFDLSALTQTEKDLCGWLEFLMEKNHPISAVEDKAYRKFSKYQTHFSEARVKKTLGCLNERIEKKISAEMKEAGRGALMYDEWTKNGYHYVGLYAVYMRLVKAVVEGKEIQELVPEIVLLSVAPMHNYVDEDDDDVIAADFNAELHAKHFRAVLDQFYDINIDDWCMCVIADNTSTNRKTARLLGLPHIGCLNHLLNLDINDWVKEDASLSELVEHLRKVMKEAKNLKNIGRLREFTHLAPYLNNATRWSGIRIMIERFLKIREALRQVAEDERTELQVDTSAAFADRCTKYLNYMVEIDSVTKKLQERCLPFCDGRIMLDDIASRVDRHNNGPNANHTKKFYGCNFEARRTKLEDCPEQHKRLHPDADFERGVFKIQTKRINELTADERQACARLLVQREGEESDEEEESSNDSDSDDGAIATLQRQRERLGRQDDLPEYGDLSFILGSAAEVERLWSHAKHILTDERMGMMHPINFEAVLYVKMNRRFWDIVDVAHADKQRIREEAAANRAEANGNSSEDNESDDE